MAYATSEGARIYWEEEGPATGEGQAGRTRADAVLLVMGLGATLEWWYRIRPVLSERYRTILFDNRGVGKSDVPPPPYSIPLMADDAVAVLDAAAVDRAHVVGLSMGGFIAQEFALRHPSRVQSLVLGCTSCGGRDAVPAEKEARVALTARASMTREEAMRAIAPFTFDPSTPREALEREFAIRLATTVADEGYFAQLQAIRDWSGALSRLSTLSAPTLVMHGETDRLVPAENGRIIATAIPNARFVMLPHASHIFFTDQFDAARDALLAFLAANERNPEGL